MSDDLPIYEDWATDYAALGGELLARLALGAQPTHAGEASAAFLRTFAGWGGAEGV